MDFFSLPCVRVHLLLQPADEPWGAERGVRLARAAEQHTVADFFENPALAKLCMDFLHGDGWALQCHCTRCKRPWLNAGWVCPIEHRRHLLCLQMLGGFFFFGYANFELSTWTGLFAALRRLHDMYTDEIPWDIRDLLEFARLSCSQAHAAQHLNNMDQTKWIKNALNMLWELLWDPKVVHQ